MLIARACFFSLKACNAGEERRRRRSRGKKEEEEEAEGGRAAETLMELACEDEEEPRARVGSLNYSCLLSAHTESKFITAVARR